MIGASATKDSEQPKMASSVMMQPDDDSPQIRNSPARFLASMLHYFRVISPQTGRQFLLWVPSSSNGGG